MGARARKTWWEKLADSKGLPKTRAITAGIFGSIAAHAAEEASDAGRKRITPWWRTLKSAGELNPKYPGGGTLQAARLRSQGFGLEPAKGHTPARVQEHEKFLMKD